MITNGIIDIDNIYKECVMTKRNEYLEMHTYEIWQSKTDKYWKTYLPDNEKGRVSKKRKEKKALEELIIKHYQDQQMNPYLKDVFYEWMNSKLEFKEICEQSYDRYETDFTRFFKNSSISNKRIGNITEDELEKFIKNSILKFNLTVKTYSGLRTLIRGMFKYAKKKNYSEMSMTRFFGDIDLPRNIFTKKIVNKKEEVFMEDEIQIIAKYVLANPTIWNLGVLLVFQTGLRVGELASLKPSDVKGRFINIERTEIKYKNKTTGKWEIKVQEIPKTEAGIRELLIPESAVKTIEMILEINSQGKYLFENQGKRIRENTFNKRLNSICQDLNIKQRSIHKARKTYGTTLIDGMVDDSIVAEQMGHKDIETTKKYYYYSNKNNENKLKQIEKAVNV